MSERGSCWFVVTGAEGRGKNKARCWQQMWYCRCLHQRERRWQETYPREGAHGVFTARWRGVCAKNVGEGGAWTREGGDVELGQELGWPFGRGHLICLPSDR